ncbi:deoxyribonuclease V [Thiohalorhabdus sp.]|uniref:deoxyribonuclease V n=1 Tax=Thiohalorhabdus sp. TaxID=3094134 RepID=UPI002FC2F9A9
MPADPRFPIRPEEARKLQDELRSRVRREPLSPSVTKVAGVDAALLKDRVVAVATLLSYPGLEVLEEATGLAPLELPYVPGLLSFREGPAVMEALDQLRRAPDLVLLDGQGIAHPRGLGIAAHIGLLQNRPAIGVAKSRLVGEADEAALGPDKGARVPLSVEGEPVGAVVRTRSRVRPLYVSPGHRVTVDDAVTWTLACCTRYRLPEPTRLADKQAGWHKRRLLSETSG